MRARISEEARLYIKTRVEELDWSWQEKCDAIRDEVRKKFDYILENGEQLRLLLKRIGDLTAKTKEISDAIPSEPPYEVIDWFYYIPTKSGKLKLSVDDADEMFQDFSKHWGNLSGDEMRQKYGLTPRAWNAIKSSLELYKTSHVFSPHSSENLEEEELDERIVDVIDKHFKDRVVGKMVVTHEKKFKKEAEKAMKFLYNQEYFLEQVREFIQDYHPKHPDITPKVIENNDRVHFFVTDIHLGKGWTDKVIERLTKVTWDIISSPERIVYLTFGWDLGETFAWGGMHPGQIESMDGKYGFGFDLMMFCVESIESMLLKLHEAGKEVHVTGILGNHWRTTQKNEDDKSRTAELVIYEMLRRSLSQYEIEINTVREKIATIDYGEVRFIVAHWDWNFDKQKPEYILNTHWDNRRYTVLVSWDKHNFQAKEWFNYTWVKSPALAWQWEYDKDLNLHSEPGYIVFKENEFGSVDVSIKRLPK